MGKKLKRGFYWRGGVIWVYTDPVTGKRTSTFCHDPGAAELWRAERERLAASPAYAASLSATVGHWVRKTLASKSAQRSDGTIHMYGVKLGHVVRLFGKDAPLAAITPVAVDDYIAKRRTEGVKSNTISRELTCLRQMLRLAKRAGAYAGDLDQVMPVGFSPEYKPVTRTLARGDLPALFAVLTEEQQAWVCLALALAADLGDVERARREDYDRVRNVMRVRGTKNTARDAEVPILEAFRSLFEFALSRLPVTWPNVSKALPAACARARLPHVSPKDLRRSAASWLVAAGADQDMVSRFLRHRGSQMVRLVYGQVRPEQVGALLESQAPMALLDAPGACANSVRPTAPECALPRPAETEETPDESPFPVPCTPTAQPFKSPAYAIPPRGRDEPCCFRTGSPSAGQGVADLSAYRRARELRLELAGLDAWSTADIGAVVLHTGAGDEYQQRLLSPDAARVIARRLLADADEAERLGRVAAAEGEVGGG